MESRELKASEQAHYFEPVAQAGDIGEGTREMHPKNADAKIFCVFDMDTVVKYGLQNKHKDFVAALDSEINSGQVVLCESMPSFEFWLLLHFTDYEGLLKNYSEVSNVLAPYLKPYFNCSTVSFKKLIKRDKYLKDSAWVNLIKTAI